VISPSPIVRLVATGVVRPRPVVFATWLNIPSATASSPLALLRSTTDRPRSVWKRDNIVLSRPERVRAARALWPRRIPDVRAGVSEGVLLC
jgi:hypothetical protein